MLSGSPVRGPAAKVVGLQGRPVVPGEYAVAEQRQRHLAPSGVAGDQVDAGEVGGVLDPVDQQGETSRSRGRRLDQPVVTGLVPCHVADDVADPDCDRQGARPADEEHDEDRDRHGQPARRGRSGLRIGGGQPVVHHRASGRRAAGHRHIRRPPTRQRAQSIAELQHCVLRRRRVHHGAEHSAPIQLTLVGL